MTTTKDAPLYFDSYDITDMAEKMQTIVEDENLSHELPKKAWNKPKNTIGVILHRELWEFIKVF